MSELESETSTDIAAAEEIVADRGEEQLSEPKRIEATISIGWRGVRDCDHSDRIAAEVKEGVRKWAADQIIANTGRRCLRYGNNAGTVNTQHYKDWDGKRSCSSGVSLLVYVEFA